jgi:hypothetical protein
VLYPLSYGGWPVRGEPGQVEGRKAMYQRPCSLQHAVGLVTSSSFYSRPVPGGRWRGCAARAAVIIVLLVLTGCVRQAAPAPAAQRSTPPPWSAPRDAISYITAAGLQPQPLGSTENSYVVDLKITVDGARVEVPPNVGIDLLRAVQAPMHTHDTSGQVSLEGRDTSALTLGHFFAVWGVRFDGRCLGSACGNLVVTVDGKVSAAPTDVRLADSRIIEITASS